MVFSFFRRQSKEEFLELPLRITRGRKKDMVSTIYHNNQKEATRKILYRISSTVLEIKKLCSYANQSVRFDNLEKMIEMVESSLVESNRRQNMKLFLMFNFP